MPPTDFQVICKPSQSFRRLNWRKPNPRTIQAWNNADDATRDGAYSVCLASIEAELGLFAVARAETRTGADYYLGAEETGLEEASYRLEVSGVDQGGVSVIATRLKQKVAQTKRGNPNLPAIASVVGFLARHVGIEIVKAE